jgi:hypothetical protein
MFPTWQFIIFMLIFDIPFQRVFESNFVGKKSIVKERFSKKYRHPTLDSKLTLKRLNAVSLSFFFFWGYKTAFPFQ